MEELTCEECGTINDADNRVCELCGDPLGEERETAEKMSLLILAPLALFTSAVSYAGGAFVFAWGLSSTHSTTGSGLMFGLDFDAFLVIYSVVWLLLVVVAPMYSPKDNYDFGGIYGNPLSYRDDLDRRHATMGCLLFPLMIVHGLWRQVFERLGGSG